MKRILVTGGLGFIGSHTVVALQNKGFEVVIIDNLSNSKIDVLEKISTMGSVLSSNFANMTEDETKKYKEFLELELKKIQNIDGKKKGKEIKIE